MGDAARTHDLVDVRTAPREKGGVMPERRRLLPRQFCDWQGRYMSEDSLDQSWRDCRIVDVSTTGAGVELLDATEEESTGCRIILAVHIAGVVRYSESITADRRRVGIQFVNLTDAERIYIESLETLGAAW